MSFVFDPTHKKLQEEYYQKGVNEGLEKAAQASYEDGFRDGVQRGIEIGLYEEFFNSSRTFLQDKKDDAKAKKILSIIEKVNKNNIEDMESKFKIVKTNLRLLLRKENSEEK